MAKPSLKLSNLVKKWDSPSVSKLMEISVWPPSELSCDLLFLSSYLQGLYCGIFYYLISLINASRSIFPQKEWRIIHPQIKGGCSNQQGSPSGSEVKNPPAMQKPQVRSLGWEDPLKEGMVAHSSSLAWRIPWAEEPSRLESTGSHRVRTWLKWLSTHKWASVDCKVNVHPLHAGGTPRNSSLCHSMILLAQFYHLHLFF